MVAEMVLPETTVMPGAAGAGIGGEQPTKRLSLREAMSAWEAALAGEILSWSCGHPEKL
jgi:hypothetical protein